GFEPNAGQVYEQGPSSPAPAPSEGCLVCSREDVVRGLVLLLVVIAGLGAVAAPLIEVRQPSPGPAVYRRAAASSAWVVASGQAKASGLVVADRLLVTCYHVVGENQTCDVVFVWNRGGKAVADRRSYLEEMPQLRRRGLAVQGKVLERSKEKDLALVE